MATGHAAEETAPIREVKLDLSPATEVQTSQLVRRSESRQVPLAARSPDENLLIKEEQISCVVCENSSQTGVACAEHQLTQCQARDPSLNTVPSSSTSNSEISPGVAPFKCHICGETFSLQSKLHSHRVVHLDIDTVSCGVCGKAFRTGAALEKHNWIHAKESPLSCDLCGGAFKTQRRLIKHQTASHPEGRVSNIDSSKTQKKDFVCSYCCKISKCRTHHEEHERIHTNEKPYDCKKCGKAFAQKSCLARHKATNHARKRKTFPCSKCGISFPTYYAMSKHRQVHKERPHVCSVCKKMFSTVLKLSKHLKEHKKEEHICCTCNKRFPTHLKLKKHSESHKSTQQLFKRLSCSKSFKKAASLQRHQRSSHKAKRKNTCKFCQKSFKKLSGLNLHLRTHAKAENIGQSGRRSSKSKSDKDKYHCGICSNSFQTYYRLRQHKQMHQERPFMCDTCEETFVTETDLSQHKQSACIDPFICDDCQKTFPTLKALQKHRIKHVMERPYLCGVCLKSFKSTNQLKAHMLNHLNGKSRLCPVCGKDFPEPKSLQRHQQVCQKHRDNCIALVQQSECASVTVYAEGSDGLPASHQHELQTVTQKTQKGTKRKKKIKSSFGEQPSNSVSNSGHLTPVAVNCSQAVISGGAGSSWGQSEQSCRSSDSHLSMQSGRQEHPASTIPDFLHDFRNQESHEANREVGLPSTLNVRAPTVVSGAQTFTTNTLQDFLTRSDTREVHVNNDADAQSSDGDSDFGLSDTFDGVDEDIIEMSCREVFSPGPSTGKQDDSHGVCQSSIGCIPLSSANQWFDVNTPMLQLVVNKIQLFSCDICRKDFQTKLFLDHHNLSHHNKNPGEIVQAGKSSTIQQSGDSEGALTCFFCEEDFHHYTELLQHECPRIHEKFVEMEAPTSAATLLKETCENLPRVSVVIENSEAVVEQFQKDAGTEMKEQSGYSQLSSVMAQSSSAVFKCGVPVCKKVFSSVSLLKRHKLTHIQERPYCCDKCDKMFHTKAHLKEHHIRAHTSLREFKCQHCDKQFCRKSDLNQHVKTHKGILAAADAEDTPIGQITGGQGVCDQQSSLQAEGSKRAKPDSQSVSKCRVCKEVFSSVALLKSHKLTHIKDKPHRCGKCDNMYRTKARLIKHHIRAHTSPKEFKCQYCDKTFSMKSDLKQHAKTHKVISASVDASDVPSNKLTSGVSSGMEVEPESRRIGTFICTVCEKTFIDQSSLSNHEHSNSGDQMHSVKSSHQNQVENLNDLEHHNSLKSNLRECNICGKHVTKNSWSRHIQGHSNERPHKCENCAKAYKQKVHLRVHQDTCKNKEPQSCTESRIYRCSNCVKEFKFKSDYERHRKTKKCLRMQSNVGEVSGEDDVADCTESNSKQSFGDSEGLRSSLASGSDGTEAISEKNTSESLKSNESAVGDTGKGSNVHVQNSNNEQPHKCEDKHGHHLQVHQANCKNKQPGARTESRVYKCGVCTKQFKFNSDYKRHQQTKKCRRNRSNLGAVSDEDNVITCTEVSSRQSSGGSGFDGMAAISIENASESLRSDKSAVGDTDSALKVQIRSHSKQHQNETHTQERPFECDKCEKTYLTKANLKEHRLRAHDKFRKFKCPICHRGFARKPEVNRHIQTHRTYRTGSNPGASKCNDATGTGRSREQCQVNEESSCDLATASDEAVLKSNLSDVGQKATDDVATGGVSQSGHIDDTSEVTEAEKGTYVKMPNVSEATGCHNHLEVSRESEADSGKDNRLPDCSMPSRATSAKDGTEMRYLANTSKEVCLSGGSKTDASVAETPATNQAIKSDDKVESASGTSHAADTSDLGTMRPAPGVRLLEGTDDDNDTEIRLEVREHTAHLPNESTMMAPLQSNEEKSQLTETQDGIVVSELHSFCNEEFPSLLKQHKKLSRKEKKSFHGDQFDKASRKNDRLREHHLQTHTKVTKFKCQVCNQEFTMKSDFKRHKQTHTTRQTMIKPEVSADPSASGCGDTGGVGSVQPCGDLEELLTMVASADEAKSRSDTKPETSDAPIDDDCQKAPFTDTPRETYAASSSNEDADNDNDSDYEPPSANDDDSDDEVRPVPDSSKAVDAADGFKESLPSSENLSGSASERTVVQQKSARGQSYSCGYCGKVFAHLSKFVAHERIHTKEKPFQCDHCDKAFTHRSSFLYHSRKVHNVVMPNRRKKGTSNLIGKQNTGGDSLTCSLCNEKFQSQTLLRRHKTGSHADKKGFKCDQCEKAYFRKSHLEEHLMSAHNNIRKFKCPICDKGFSRKSYVIRHKQTHITGLKKITTGPSDGAGGVTSHKVNIKRITCNLCDEVFPSATVLRNHKLQSHGEVRPFACELCNKTYLMQAHLKEHHMFAHTELRRFKCHLCNGGFHRDAEFERHKESHRRNDPMFASGEALKAKSFAYVCLLCKEEFPSIVKLKDHERSMHQMGRRYTCLKCLEHFTSRVILKRHEFEVHAGSETLTCKICGKTCPSKASLGRHEYMHWCKNAKECTLCGEKHLPSKQAERATFHKRHSGWQYEVRKAEKRRGKNEGTKDVCERSRRGNRRFQCMTCGGSFLKTSSYKRHQEIHAAGGELNFCRSCGKHLKTARHLDKHKLMFHSGERSEERVTNPSGEPRKCEKCQREFGNRVDLIKHLKDVHVKQCSLYCEQCRGSFQTVWRLKAHKQQMHPAGPVKLYACTVCNKRFRSQYFLRKHKVIHSAKAELTCAVCNAEFKTNQCLRAHKRKNHRSDQEFICGVCGKRLSAASTLKQHMVTHSNQRPFICEHCGKSYKCDRGLRRHKQTRCYETREFICQFCGKSYPKYNHLVLHLRCHQEKRSTPCTCPMCPKVYRYQKLLTQHINRTHKNRRPFVCDVCHKKFHTRTLLKTHQNIHTGAKPYKCEICGDAFRQSSTLYRHVKGVHKKGKKTNRRKQGTMTKKTLGNKPASRKTIHRVEKSRAILGYHLRSKY